MEESRRYMGQIRSVSRTFSFYLAVLHCVCLTALPLYSAQTILTGVPRPGINERVRTFVINSVTDARCLVSASGFEDQDSNKALADCRQKHMVLEPVIDVGAKLAIAMENKLRQSGVSESAIKSGVKRRLQIYDGCVRNEIGPRQTLPLEGLAQLCAVSTTGSPRDGVSSMVTQEKSDTKISVYDFDEVIFDSLITQESGGASSILRDPSPVSCKSGSCNRCRDSGFGSNHIMLKPGNLLYKSLPSREFKDTVKAPVKEHLEPDEIQTFVQSLKAVSSDLVLDDFWYVNDVKTGFTVCMACPSGYSSNGVDACVRNGCELGEKNCGVVCRGAQVRTGPGGNACAPLCEEKIREAQTLLRKVSIASVSPAGNFRYNRGSLPREKLFAAKKLLDASIKICKTDRSQQVPGSQDFEKILESPSDCLNRRRAMGALADCEGSCNDRTIYPGSMDFGNCPVRVVETVIRQIFQERGRKCAVPLTSRDIKDRIAEIGFNCEAYGPTANKRTDESGADRAKIQPE